MTLAAHRPPNVRNGRGIRTPETLRARTLSVGKVASAASATP